MSQLAPVRPLPRTSPRRAAAPTPRQLKVVAPPEIQGNGMFLALCVALLLGGFVGVLMLNTAMAKGSYTMRDLQRRSDALADTQDPLRHTIDARLRAPAPSRSGPATLGMVPAETAAFLRLSDGKVLGVAKKAKANEPFSVVTESKAPTRSTPVASTPAPSAGTPAATQTRCADEEARRPRSPRRGRGGAKPPAADPGAHDPLTDRRRPAPPTPTPRRARDPAQDAPALRGARGPARPPSRARPSATTPRPAAGRRAQGAPAARPRIRRRPGIRQPGQTARGHRLAPPAPARHRAARPSAGRPTGARRPRNARPRPPRRPPPDPHDPRLGSAAAGQRWWRHRPPPSDPRGGAPGGNPRRRMRFLTVASLFVLSIFGAQLVRIQGFDAQAVAEEAQLKREAAQIIPAMRGQVLASDGTVLASSVVREVVVADQQAVCTYGTDENTVRPGDVRGGRAAGGDQAGARCSTPPSPSSCPSSPAPAATASSAATSRR